MSLRFYANAPATTLTASCSAVATSIDVASVVGLPISYPYIMILDRGTASEEVVLVTAASSNTLTVTRGFDNSTAFAHATGAAVAHGVSAIDLREANLHGNSTTGVHGISGGLVGTTDAQTLTNKTLGATNIINGFATNRLMVSDATGKMVAGSAVPAGGVAGVNEAQTLTNKTFDSTSPTAFLPPGMVMMSAGVSVPNGWLACNGAAVSRTTYAALFAAIGTAYGVGNGSTTFNLPNLTDRFPVGTSVTKTRGMTGGESEVTLLTENLPSHNHTTLAHSHSLPSHTHGLLVSTVTNTSTGGSGARVAALGSGSLESTLAGGSGLTGSSASDTTFTGEDVPVDIMPPWASVGFVIKT